MALISGATLADEDAHETRTPETTTSPAGHILSVPTSASEGRREETGSNMGVNEITRLIALLFRKLGRIVMSNADHMNHTTDACFPNSLQMNQTLTSNQKCESTLKWLVAFQTAHISSVLI